jgi:hypothetical protein
MIKKVVFLLCILLSQPSLADLYKCSVTTGTHYQDKPCQSAQTQVVIKQIPHKTSPSSTALSRYPLQIERDARGRIKRSEKAKNDFKATHPCPSNGHRAGTCSGYVIDHINPLACGGADSPENMQWQTVRAGKEKDGWERDDCDSPIKQPLRYPSVLDNKVSPSQKSVATEPQAQTVYTGKRGGRYVFTKSGKKRYLPRQ